jgi:hypothetical protein
VLNSIPKGTKFNQGYFIDAVFSDLSSERARIAKCKGLPSFSVQISNSMCHHGAEITEKHRKKHIARAPHSPSSPDLSPCDFWLFEFLKEKMKDRVLRSEEQILAAIAKNWNELTFEDIQRVFQNWMDGQIWLISNSGEDYQS